METALILRLSILGGLLVLTFFSLIGGFAWLFPRRRKGRDQSSNAFDPDVSGDNGISFHESESHGHDAGGSHDGH